MANQIEDFEKCMMEIEGRLVRSETALIGGGMKGAGLAIVEKEMGSLGGLLSKAEILADEEEDDQKVLRVDQARVRRKKVLDGVREVVRVEKGALQRVAREELLGRAGKREGTTEDMAKSITESLRRTHAMLDSELGRTQATSEVVDEQTRSLQTTKETYAKLGARTQEGKSSVQRLRMRETAERWSVNVAMLLFFVVVLFVLRRRVSNTIIVRRVIQPVGSRVAGWIGADKVEKIAGMVGGDPSTVIGGDGTTGGKEAESYVDEKTCQNCGADDDPGGFYTETEELDPEELQFVEGSPIMEEDSWDDEGAYAPYADEKTVDRAAEADEFGNIELEPMDDTTGEADGSDEALPEGEPEEEVEDDAEVPDLSVEDDMHLEPEEARDVEVPVEEYGETHDAATMHSATDEEDEGEKYDSDRDVDGEIVPSFSGSKDEEDFEDGGDAEANRDIEADVTIGSDEASGKAGVASAAAEAVIAGAVGSAAEVGRATISVGTTGVSGAVGAAAGAAASAAAGVAAGGAASTGVNVDSAPADAQVDDDIDLKPIVDATGAEDIGVDNSEETLEVEEGDSEDDEKLKEDTKDRKEDDDYDYYEDDEYYDLYNAPGFVPLDPDMVTDPPQIEPASYIYTDRYPELQEEDYEDYDEEDPYGYYDDDDYGEYAYGRADDGDYCYKYEPSIEDFFYGSEKDLEDFINDYEDIDTEQCFGDESNIYNRMDDEYYAVDSDEDEEFGEKLRGEHSSDEILDDLVGDGEENDDEIAEVEVEAPVPPEADERRDEDEDVDEDLELKKGTEVPVDEVLTEGGEGLENMPDEKAEGDEEAVAERKIGGEPHLEDVTDDEEREEETMEERSEKPDDTNDNAELVDIPLEHVTDDELSEGEAPGENKASDDKEVPVGDDGKTAGSGDDDEYYHEDEYYYQDDFVAKEVEYNEYYYDEYEESEFDRVAVPDEEGEEDEEDEDAEDSVPEDVGGDAIERSSEDVKDNGDIPLAAEVGMAADAAAEAGAGSTARAAAGAAGAAGAAAGAAAAAAAAAAGGATAGGKESFMGMSEESLRAMVSDYEVFEGYDYFDDAEENADIDPIVENAEKAGNLEEKVNEDGLMEEEDDGEPNLGEFAKPVSDEDDASTEEQPQIPNDSLPGGDSLPGEKSTAPEAVMEDIAKIAEAIDTGVGLPDEDGQYDFDFAGEANDFEEVEM